MFVLDASIALCWAFDDELSPQATLAFERIRSDEAIVPALWWFELRNGLLVNERRKRIAEADSISFLRQLSRLPIAVDSMPDESDVMGIARKHRLTVYDASYLELARRRSIPLATLDADLAAAAKAERVALLGKTI